MAIVTSYLLQPCDIDEVQLAQNGFVGVKVFYMEHVFAYHSYSFKACGILEALTSTTIFMKCGVKTSRHTTP